MAGHAEVVELLLQDERFDPCVPDDCGVVPYTVFPSY